MWTSEIEVVRSLHAEDGLYGGLGREPIMATAIMRVNSRALSKEHVFHH